MLRGDGSADAAGWATVGADEWASVAAGRDLLFATHGFNVSRAHGAAALDRLGRTLDLGAAGLFVGLLWPGDAWIPVVDYPFEGGVAIDCGQRLAAFCNASCASAQSLAFFSHSLGARVVLEAVARLDRKARLLCVAAGAVNRDCLWREYWDASLNASRITVLASRKDLVLKVAFAVGDPLADLLHDDHTPFQAALGATGPAPPEPVAFPWQIPDDEDYGHGDYLPPPDDGDQPPPADAQWLRVAGFLGRAFRGEPQTWPGAAAG